MGENWPVVAQIPLSQPGSRLWDDTPETVTKTQHCAIDFVIEYGKIWNSNSRFASIERDMHLGTV